MKILVFSDSHRNVRPMVNAVVRESPNTIIHLGDHESDAEALSREFPDIPITSVPGNCDLAPFGKRFLSFTLAGKSFFITHGHPYGVKMGYNSLINTAAAAGADIALFGHTHIPYSTTVSGMLVCNPGSVGMDSRTYGVLTIENGEIKYEKKDS